MNKILQAPIVNNILSQLNDNDLVNFAEVCLYTKLIKPKDIYFLCYIFETILKMKNPMEKEHVIQIITKDLYETVNKDHLYKRIIYHLYTSVDMYGRNKDNMTDVVMGSKYFDPNAFDFPTNKWCFNRFAYLYSRHPKVVIDSERKAEFVMYVFSWYPLEYEPMKKLVDSEYKNLHFRRFNSCNKINEIHKNKALVELLLQSKGKFRIYGRQIDLDIRTVKLALEMDPGTYKGIYERFTLVERASAETIRFIFKYIKSHEERYLIFQRCVGSKRFEVLEVFLDYFKDEITDEFFLEICKQLDSYDSIKKYVEYKGIKITFTHLKAAIKKGNLRTAQAFIDCGGDINCSNGYFLDVATVQNKENVINFLLKNKADIREVPIRHLARHGNFKMVHVLLGKLNRLEVCRHIETKK